MSTFKEYTGTIDAGQPLMYCRSRHVVGLLRKPTRVETLEFSAAVATQAHLKDHYDEEPMVFLKTIQESIKIDPGIAFGQKALYLRHCKTVVTLHAYSYLAHHAYDDKIPSTTGKKNDLIRLEYKWLLAKLYAEDLLERDTYHVIQMHCPELYCRREYVLDPSEELAQSVPPAPEELATSDESSDELPDEDGR